ncbi:MAG: ATP-binding protein [Gemmatimonadales bacterium]|nr:MAG: ATP-binding protein [Gemmatimonadales bacterium]
MLGQAWSASLQGVEGVPIRVEAQVVTGIPGLFIVGLPRGAVREGRDRIQSALRNLPGASDALRVTINLAPADLMKDGSALDLAMAVALVAGAGLVPAPSLHGTAFVGELGLDGRLHPVRGVLPLALGCVHAGLARLVVPEQNLPEAESLADEIELLGAASLQQVVGFLRGETALAHPAAPGFDGADGFGAPIPGPRQGRPGATGDLRASGGDLASIRGQALGRRALEIAAAGSHPLLLAGPPGAGKTMLARALPGLLPDLDRRCALEVTAIHSVAGLLPAGVGLLSRPPFRAPHHGASQGALVGGGTPLRPGEVTLAHRGVLFLDELAHWIAPALDALREPLETGFVDVIRTGQRARFPASFLLVAAMNPCPCGRLGSTGPECTCDPSVVRRYQSRVSGPLLDRVDLRVRLDPPPAALLLRAGPGETSSAVRSRVAAARAMGAGQRNGGALGAGAGPAAAAGYRSGAGGTHLPPHTRAAGQALEAAAVSLRLSARGVVRVLEVARTISCLAGRDVVEEDHVAEALHFRQL